MPSTSHHPSLPPTAARLMRVSEWMTAAARTVSGGFGALNVLLVLVILVQISLRHIFTGGHQIILGELQWHLYATAMMFGLAYSQSIDAHVRVDAVSRKWTPRRRALIEIFGNLFLIMPFVLIMFLQGLDYVADSWRIGESSASPVGLPWRWLIKSVIPISFSVWFVALAARLLRDVIFVLYPAAFPADDERSEHGEQAGEMA